MKPDSSKHQSAGEHHCPRCGTDVSAEAGYCWLCYAPLRGQPAKGKAAKKAATAPSSTTWPAPVAEPARGFSLASMLMFVTLACVVLGVASIAPGLAVPLGVVMLVVWAQTAMAVRRRASRGVAVSTMEKLQMFMSSFAFVLVMLICVGVAAVAAFFAVCAAIISAFDPSVAPYVIVAAAIAVFAFVGVMLMARHRARRWRQEQEY